MSNRDLYAALRFENPDKTAAMDTKRRSYSF